MRRDKVRVVRIDEPYGEETSWTALKGPNAWHVSASPKGDLMICDTNWDDTGLWVIESVIGQPGKLFNLCLTKSDWQHPKAKDLHAHPHPGWSPDGRYIHFTSFNGATESMDLYLVDLSQNPFN